MSTDSAARLKALLAAAHRRHRRRHGHDDPGPPARARRTSAASASRTTRKDLKGNSDLLCLTQPDVDRGDPPPVPRGGRRHRRDQHLQRARRSRWPTTAWRRTVYELNVAGARGWRGARWTPFAAEHPDAAALRGRRAGADQPHGLDVARRQRPRRAPGHLRRAGGGLPRAGARPGRRRRRPAAGGDHLRHAELQGRAVRHRAACSTRAARRRAGHGLGHDRGPERPHALRARRSRRSGTRSRTPTCSASGINCALGAEADAAVRRGAVAHRARASSAATRTRACPTRSAASTRRRSAWRPTCASSRRTAGSTSWAAAAARRPTHIRAIAEAVRGLTPRELPHARAATRACQRPGAADHPARTPTSSTSASAPTSPARPSSPS